jgi:hypothetical protein
MKVLSTRTLGKEGHFGAIKEGLAREWGQRNKETKKRQSLIEVLPPVLSELP